MGNQFHSTESTEKAWDGQREAMVQRQIEARGIRDPQVLEAFRRVPRHEFVPEKFREESYEDHPVPIGSGQTISQPYIVAFMTDRLNLTPESRVLEIGTGCGYQTAILAQIVQEVNSIEIVESLCLRARSDMARLGYTNAHISCRDGFAGLPEQAPFDAILSASAAPEVPQPWLDQLAEGGRLVMPVGSDSSQFLKLFEKLNGEIQEHNLLAVRFVSMTGEGA